MKAARIVVQVSIVGGLAVQSGSLLGAIGFSAIAVALGLIG